VAVEDDPLGCGRVPRGECGRVESVWPVDVADGEGMMRKRKLTPAGKLRALREELKQREGEVRKLRELREFDKQYYTSETATLKAQLADKEDKLLPQKQQILKELAYLTNATARAVRTTMWSLTPVERRGFGR
jgi:hypothetical protein